MEIFHFNIKLINIFNNFGMSIKRCYDLKAIKRSRKLNFAPKKIIKGSKSNNELDCLSNSFQALLIHNHNSEVSSFKKYGTNYAYRW